MSALDILEKLQGIEIGALNPLQRILIITDGTLTEILEAAFLERIALIKLAQQTMSPTPALQRIAAHPGDVVLERKILLRGEQSRKNYVYAETFIAVNRLPPAFHDQLMNSDVALGRLWREHRLETFKELLEVKQVQAGLLAEHFNCKSSAPLLVRTYCVTWAAKPVMLISEYFPLDY